MAEKIKLPKDYFTFERRVLKVCGISLYWDNSKLYNVYAFIVILTTPYLYTISAVVDLAREHSFANLPARIMYDSCIFLDLVKITVKVFNRKKVIRLLDKLHTGTFMVNLNRGGAEEEKLIKRSVYFHRLVRNVYFSIGMSTISGSIIYSLINRLRSTDSRDWKLGFGSLTILNITSTPNFEITMVYQDVSFLYASVQFLTLDVLFCNIVSQVCAQFCILKNSLKHLVDNSYKKMLQDTHPMQDFSEGDLRLKNIDPSIIPLKYLQQTLREAVIHHMDIINITKDLEELYSVMLLIIYLTNMIIFCFGLYICSIMPLTDPSVTNVITAVMSFWVQSLLLCYWCNEMSNHSQEVADAAYAANFVGTHPSFQRDLSFIIRRSQYPVVITAGKFFNITLTPFVKAQQAAYSLFMLLKKTSVPAT